MVTRCFVLVKEPLRSIWPLPPPPTPSPRHPLPYLHAHPHAPVHPTPPASPPATCFPLSISGHLSPRPSTPVRLAPWQIRLVPLCRLFRRPPTGPSDHRPASAWQIRFVSLCRLVRRRSNPSCAASLQERAGRKKRDGQFKATQTLRRSRIPQAEGAGLALPTAAGGGAATTCSCR